MAKRHSQPAVEEPKFKKRAKVGKTETGLTHTSIEVVPDDPTQATVEGDVRTFLDQALRRFQLAVDAETYNRIEGLQDMLMVDGDGQWDDDIRGKRQRKKRPCLTINRFIPMLSHVANEQRMSRPAIQIDPVGGGADPEDAQIRQGLIRNIEVTSSAETVYDTAFERMIEKGWSWFRIVTEWESPTSFDQVIKIEGFPNDFCVYSDPSAEDPTRKDMKWAFVVYDMPRGEYETQHKGSRAASLTEFASLGDSAPNWITTDSVRVAEYYYMDEEPVNAVKTIGGGDGVWEDEIEELPGERRGEPSQWFFKADLEKAERRAGRWFHKGDLAKYDADETQMPAEAVREVQSPTPVPVQLGANGKPITRKSVRLTPKWAKINAVEILDGNNGEDFETNSAGRKIAGKYIPLVMVCGRERIVKGQRRLAGMVRNNRDAQRMYNYMASGFAEMIALAPKSPFIAAIGQIEDFKSIWDSANDENWPWLPYKPKSIDGQQVPAPQRQNMEPPVAAYLQGLSAFDNILKIGFNIFDPSLGTAKSDQSGRAIAGLQSRSDSANMNWMDNMRRAQIYAGQIILEMIPEIYDAERTIVIDRASQKESVLINQEFVGKDGKPKKHDMAVGKYSVTVSLGQYASKRQQTVQSLTDIAKNVPQVSLALLPLILDNMDSPMAAEAAAIVKRMQPAAMQEPGSPEQQQQQFQALMQQQQKLVLALNRANEILKTKQLDNATKEAIAGLQAQAQIVAAGLKAGSTAAMQQGAQEYDRITQLLDQLHERVMLESEAVHDVRLELIQQAQPAAPAQPQPAGATA